MEGPMTNLRQLLAHNMKERRQILKMSQYRLAQKAGTSTYYIGMIETLKKYPSPEMMQRIASGLGIDTPELFSMTSSYPAGFIKRSQKDVLKLFKESVESILERKLVQLDNRK
jgi:transcriptional regulator with XRE-family HTH domain